MRQLEYLVAVADTGTIADAAARCLVSPVAVGQALKDLDRSLGAELTKRQRAKGVTLTPAGEAVVDRARNVLREVSQLPLIIDAEVGRQARRLRFGVFASLSTWAVPALLKYFAAKTPEVKVDYLEGDFEVLRKNLEEGEIDFFLANSHQLSLQDSTLQIFPVKEVRPYILVSEHHRLAHRDGIRFSDCIGEDFVLLGLSPAYERMTEILEGHGIAEQVRWHSRNVETVNGIVGSGLAIALHFSFGHRRMSLDGERLVSLPVLDAMPNNVAVVCIPQKMKVSQLVQESIDHLQVLAPPGTAAPTRSDPA